MDLNPAGRHPATVNLLRFFASDHLPSAGLQEVARRCEHLAQLMVRNLPDCPELSVGLRKLLEAKDYFVRAALPPQRTVPVEDEFLHNGTG